MGKSIGSIVLAGLLGVCINLDAAENPSATKPVEAAKLAIPDLTKPVWVIIQCDKVKTLPPMSAEQKKKVGSLLNGLFFNGPGALGFALEQGKVTRPWLISPSWCPVGTGSERSWSHAPLTFISAGYRQQTFTDARTTMTGGRISSSLKGTYDEPHLHLSAPAEFDLAITGSVDGARIEGEWTGTICGFPCSGTCVGAILQAASTALDPANAIYQIESTESGAGVVVEVRNGKGVDGLAHRMNGLKNDLGVLLTTVCKVDAAGLSVTADLPTIAGPRGTLKGTIKIAGVGDLSVDGLFITPTGFGGRLQWIWTSQGK